MVDEPKNDKCTDTYKQRNDGEINIAEKRFEDWCTKNNYEFHRFGFDEKKDPVSCFYNISSTIRSLPDYLLVHNGKILYIHIKGTNKIKLSDIIDYSMFERQFCIKETVCVGFFFENKYIIKSLSDIKKMLTGLTVMEFENDKKQYFSLVL